MPSRAIELYQQALKAHGSNAVAIVALERLLGKEKRWDEMAALLESRLDVSEEEEAKVQLGLALAEVRERHLSDPEGAIEAYRKVLAARPKEGSALARLANVLEQQKKFREWISVLDRIGEAADNRDTRAEIEAKVGDVLRIEMDDGAGALIRYRKSLEYKDDGPVAVRGLEALQNDMKLRPQAGALLEGVYERLGRHRDLVLALESQLLALVETEKRRDLFLRIARVEETELEDPDAAFETLACAFRESLLTPEDRAWLFKVALKSNQARALMTLYEDVLQDAAKRGDAELFRELARIYDRVAVDPSRARTGWERLLERKPGDHEALSALERIHGAGDDALALGEVLVAQAETKEGQERIQVLKRASAIYEEAAQDLDRAIFLMEKVRDAAPTERSVWQELQRLYQSTNRKENLREALRAELALLEEPHQRAKVLGRLAKCLVDLDERSEAVCQYEVMLALEPQNQAAKEGLEALLESEVAGSAAEALEPVYRAKGDWSQLVEIYEILLDASTERQDRVERLLAIRSIYEERLERYDKAFSATVRAYREAPSNKGLLHTLEHLASRAGMEDDFIALLEDQAESIAVGESARHELRMEIARLSERLLDDQSLKVAAWSRVVEEKEDSLDALWALERLHREADDAEPLVKVLREISVLETEPEAKLARLAEAADILGTKLSDPEEASRVYEGLRELEPNNQMVLSKLEHLYTELENFHALSDILEEQIGKTAGVERARLVLRLGHLESNALNKQAEAIAHFSQVLEQGPELSGGAYDGALFALDDLIDSLGDERPRLAADAAKIVEPHWYKKKAFDRVLSSKQLALRAESGAEKKFALSLELAAFYENELGQPEMAFLELARAHNNKPDDEALASALVRLAKLADAEEELAKVFEDAFPSVRGAEVELFMLRYVARIYDLELEQGTSAAPYYARTLELVPADVEAWTALERIYRHGGDAEALVQVYRHRLCAGDDEPSVQKELLHKIARIHRDELQNPEAAIEAYRSLVSLDPKDREALKLLASVSEEANRMDDFAWALAEEVDLVLGVEERVRLLLRLATVYRERLERPKEAVESYVRVLELRKDDEGALSGLSILAKTPGEGQVAAARALAPLYA